MLPFPRSDVVHEETDFEVVGELAEAFEEIVGGDVERHGANLDALVTQARAAFASRTSARRAITTMFTPRAAMADAQEPPTPSDPPVMSAHGP